jgi:8-oxo-dGTP diphosphatase
LKTIKVVAAVMRSVNENGEPIVYATQRGYGEYKGWWEFPGGKIEAGETPQQALVREIKEELTAEIEVEELIRTIEYDYPTFHLSMDCFWAEVISGHLELKEAEDARWLGKKDIMDVNWLPADLELVEDIKRLWTDQK